MNPALAFILVLFENNTDSVNTGLCTSQYLLANVYLATVTEHLTGTHLWIFYYITSLAIFDESKSNVYLRIRK
jgi:hypothetical protein